MKKVIVNTLAALATARRLFTHKGKAGTQEALVTRDKAQLAEREQPAPANLSARQQRRREAIGGRGRRRRQLKPRVRRKRFLKIALSVTIGTLGVVGSGISIYSLLSTHVPIS